MPIITKKYLHCTVTRNNGSIFVNELQMKEVHLISKLAQEHFSVQVRIREVGEAQFKSIFG